MNISFRYLGFASNKDIVLQLLPRCKTILKICCAVLKILLLYFQNIENILLRVCFSKCLFNCIKEQTVLMLSFNIDITYNLKMQLWNLFCLCMCTLSAVPRPFYNKTPQESLPTRNKITACSILQKKDFKQVNFTSIN